MAELIGVTYQQAHKYEKGINRVAAAGCTVLPKRWESKSAISSRDYSSAVVLCRPRAGGCSWNSLAIS